MFGCRGIEQREPATNDLPEAIALEAIDVAASFTSDAHQTRSFEDVEVAGGRRPAVREALREIARRQLASEVREQLHDVASDLVRKRSEHALGLFEPGRRGCDVGWQFGRHTQSLLACVVSVRKVGVPGQVDR